MHKPCHEPHGLQITTWGPIFAETFFGVSKEWVRSWSHAFLIINFKTLAKNLLAVCKEKETGKKTKKN